MRFTKLYPTVSALKIMVLLLPFLMAVGANPSWAGPKINPGEWKYTMKTKIKGLGIPLPSIPVKFTDCVTRTDASPVETPQMKKAGCKILKKTVKIKGNRFTYTARCTQGDSVTDTHYKMTFHANSMKGTFDQVRKVGGKVRSTATGTMKGKRIGPCKAD